MKKIVYILICSCLFASCATNKNIVHQEEPKSEQLDSTEQLFKKLEKSVFEEDAKTLSNIFDTTPPIEVRNAINKKCADGKTLLHKAVLSESAQIVRLLLSSGADKNIKDNNQKTSVDYARDARNKRIRELFGIQDEIRETETKIIDEKKEKSEDSEVTKTEDIFAGFSSQDSYRIIFGATDSKFLNAVKEQDYSTVSKLLKNGQNINETDMLGNNALFYAIDSQNDAIINLLISYSINCNRQNKQGQIPLLFAVANGNISEISALIKAGANINKEDLSGYTAAGIAVLQRNVSLLKYLVSNGATLHQKDAENNTLLHIAIQNEDVSTTRFLLEQDCDVYAPNNYGITPLDLLKKSNRAELKEFAKDYE